MSVERPTFSESWYRVRELRPKLRNTLQIYRQHYRGQMWHVVQDPSSNQFFRLNESAYRFVGLLDGRRTVAESWTLCNDRLGDDAPTQNEVIQLLGQLYASNLLQGDMPPDAEGLFQRYRKRVQREVKGYLANFLFIRIPLIDPDRFLDRWTGVFGKFFSKAGLALWIIVVGIGLYAAIGNAGQLAADGRALFERERLVDNLPWLYVSFILIKVFHELGHAFACKKFGQLAGSGGEVHTIGIMFLIFTPIPYVDASSAWAMRNKWHRIVVGSAGILVELFLASIAAVVWANTSPGAVNIIAFNVMFIASISTLLFNANPLLRYDGYYILSDIVEIPNLSQRSKEYIYYLVKKAWGVRNPRNPAHSRGETAWMLFYGVASTIYRVFICYRILLFIADRFFMLGMALALGAVAMWVIVPIGKYVHYLATSGELARVRGRAVGSTLAFVFLLALGIGAVPADDTTRGEGIVEPLDMAVVYALADGFVVEALPTDAEVAPDGAPLLVAVNPELEALRKQLVAQREEIVIRRNIARLVDEAQAQILSGRLEALQRQLERVESQIADLTLHAPIAGTWVAPKADRYAGAFVRRGEAVGTVVDLRRLRVRGVAAQDLAVDKVERVQIRVKNRPPGYERGGGWFGLRPRETVGLVEQVLPAGRHELPSPALGHVAGGTVLVELDERLGARAAERVFEVWIALPDELPERLLPGQRVALRYELPRSPLAYQWMRSIMRLVQKRFRL